MVVAVIAMRYGLVTAAWTVPVRLLMPFAVVLWRADIRILRPDRNDVLVNMAAMNMVQVTVMQIVGMTFVDYCGVATTCTVNVGVPFVNMMRADHEISDLCNHHPTRRA